MDQSGKEHSFMVSVSAPAFRFLPCLLPVMDYPLEG